MKLALMLPVKSDNKWTLAKQIGVDHAITKAAPELSGALPPWDYDSLSATVRRFRDAGFALAGLEGDQFDMSKIKLNLPGRDEDIDKYRQMLRNMGKLGIGLLCYNFMAGVGWFRTRFDLPERGGALTSEFNFSELPPEPAMPVITQAELWSNYKYFIDAVMPAAEASGVVMGLHPDDPPLPQLKGFGRIFINADAYRRAMSLSESPSHGITFCQATFRAMGEDVTKLIPEFASRIKFFHFRDITGDKNCFRETFHDNGPTDMPALLALLKANNIDCVLRPDHTPALAGEGHGTPGYEMLGNLFAVGYIKGILDTLNIKY